MGRSELPKNWRIVSLEDVADFVNGYSFKSTDWDVSGLPIIRIQNLNDGSKPFNRFSAEIDEKYKVRSGDVLISWSASLGAYFWEGGEAWLNQHIFKAVINENTIDRDFFFWIMKNRIDKIAESARGSTMKHVTRKTFINSTIPLPPLPEQRAIARALRAVQGARESRLREMALEKERKAALMEHLFTKGTRGEATKMTEIGEMPESWDAVRLGDICIISTGTTPSTDQPEYYQGDIPFIKTSEIANKRIAEAETYLNQVAVDRYNLKIFVPGTVFLAMYGQGKTRGQAAILDISAATTQNTAAIAPNDGLHSEFLWQWLMNQYDKLREAGSQGHISHLNLGYVKQYKIPLPLKSEQHLIVDILGACDSRIAALEHEARLHHELFRAMLEELMSGRLSAGALVEDVA